MPGYTRTERLAELVTHMAHSKGIPEADVEAGWKAETPAGRLGEPAELGALAAFLASEQAAYVTGQSIAVDGGWIRSLL
jgi:NAD(P)-dependent dehydrogenase (short-subunit alcohol dehydrogenase family)